MSESNLPKKVLLIDDDVTVGNAVRSGLENYGVELINCQSIDQALALFQQDIIDITVVENDFGPIPGLVLIQKLRSISAHPERRACGFILISGKQRKLSDEILLKELMDIELMIKPVNLIQILPVLSRSQGRKLKNFQFESFRKKLLAMVAENQQNEATQAVIRNMQKLGQRGIKLLCELYSQANMIEQALDFIESICSREPGNRSYQYEKAKILLRLGRANEAEPLLESFHQDSPDNIERITELSSAYLNQGKIDKVFSLVKDQVRLNPEENDLAIKTMKNIISAGYIEEGKTFCKENFSSAEVIKFFNNEGVKKSKMGDIGGAIAEYEMAIKVFPTSKDNYRFYFNIALAQIKLKNSSAYSAAAENLRKCLELNPAFTKAKDTLDSLTVDSKKAG